MTGNSIQYIRNKDIDRVKWDNCIHSAPNGLIYGYAGYLDIMARQWDALVMNDYEAVMPLPRKSKYGFPYLYQPAFTPMLGVFGRNLNTRLLGNFIHAIPPEIRYIDLDLNEGNNELESVKLAQPLRSYSRNNFFLPLNKDHQGLRKDYRRLANRMLSRAQNTGMQVTTDISVEEAVDFYRRHYREQHPKTREDDYNRLVQILHLLRGKGQLQQYRVISPSAETSGIYLALTDGRYVYSLLGGTTPPARSDGAFYLLTDAVLRQNADSGKLFRFEGSDHQGIAFFNSQFGPVRQHYLHLLGNALPTWCRWLKPS